MIQLYHGDEYLYIGSPLHTCHHYMLVAINIYFHGVTTALLQVCSGDPMKIYFDSYKYVVVTLWKYFSDSYKYVVLTIRKYILLATGM
jgi:hypothetical protein